MNGSERMWWVRLVVLFVGIWACGCDDGDAQAGGVADAAEPAVDGAVDAGPRPDAASPDAASPAFALEALSRWQRHGEPILRDPEPGGGYEVASDPHVFRTADGALRMVYTGPYAGADLATIKLASGRSRSEWSTTAVLLPGGESNAGGLDASRETAFYRRARSGRHQIYYIGYADERYESQIFLAEADALEGPYDLPEAPIIATGEQAGNPVATMTSPSIVEHDGRLYMVYCAWNAFPEPTAVWIHGAVSDDDGQTWRVVGEVDVPVCMEGALTAGPDGRFYAVAQGEGGFRIGRSETPFPEGGYEVLPEPVMVPAGAPWEIDEMNTPQLLFEGPTAYLYYTGAEHRRGWWVMLATAELR